MKWILPTPTINEKITLYMIHLTTFCSLFLAVKMTHEYVYQIKGLDTYDLSIVLQAISGMQIRGILIKMLNIQYILQ